MLHNLQQYSVPHNMALGLIAKGSARLESDDVIFQTKSLHWLKGMS